MIKVEGLTKYYGDLSAVENLSLSLQAGEIVGLLGPNGAGKTTTMRLLTGFMPPTAGTIRVGGFDLMEHPIQAKRLIGYLPERPPLYPELTVAEYLDFAAALHGVPSEHRAAYVDEALERSSLGPVSHRLIGNLSRGYQQRTGLAQVLVKKPQVLILDEPTNGLDPKQIAAMRGLIKELAGDYTVILSSHILQEVSATCERVIIINKGRIVAQGRQEDLIKNATEQEVYRVQLKGVAPSEAEAAFKKLNGVKEIQISEEGGLMTLKLCSEPSPHLAEHIFTLLKEKDWVPYELAREHSSLEAVFLQLTEDT